MIKWIKRKLNRHRRRCGLYECFHCGARTVVWGADFSFEDYGLEGEGIIHECSCANCGARITYFISIPEED